MQKPFPSAPQNRASLKSPRFYRIPKAAPRVFSVHTVQKIRSFSSLQAASRYIDLRLAKKPAFMFNIQQTAPDVWTVSRVIAGSAK